MNTHKHNNYNYGLNYIYINTQYIYSRCVATVFDSPQKMRVFQKQSQEEEIERDREITQVHVNKNGKKKHNNNIKYTETKLGKQCA